MVSDAHGDVLRDGWLSVDDTGGMWTPIIGQRWNVRVSPHEPSSCVIVVIVVVVVADP